MSQISCTALLPVTLEAAWIRLTAFTDMHEWFFGVKAVTVSEGPLRLGGERTVILWDGSCYRERIVHWEPGKRFEFLVLNPPPLLLESCKASIQLTPGSGGVLVRWTIFYTMRPGIARRLLEWAVLRPALKLAVSISLRRLRFAACGAQ
jgi:hypothetical protein